MNRDSVRRRLSHDRRGAPLLRPYEAREKMTSIVVSTSTGSHEEPLDDTPWRNGVQRGLYKQWMADSTSSCWTVPCLE